MAVGGINHTFVCPRSPNDPPAAKVRESFRVTQDGFESKLCAVRGTLYVGCTSAGGEGIGVDIDGDGKPDVTFAAPCRFVVQLREGKIAVVEADRQVNVDVRGKTIQLSPYVPAVIGAD